MLFALLSLAALVGLDAGGASALQQLLLALPVRAPALSAGWPYVMLLMGMAVLRWRPREHFSAGHLPLATAAFVYLFGVSVTALRLAVFFAAFCLDVWRKGPYLNNPARPLPPLTKGTPGSAGIDLPMASRCTMDDDGRFYFDTGVTARIPPGYFGLIVPRSSAARHLHITGVVDSDYEGTLMVQGVELTPGVDWSHPVAQLVFVPHALTPSVSARRSHRGKGCLGSTNCVASRVKEHPRASSLPRRSARHLQD